jgi:hypothetical protein
MIEGLDSILDAQAMISWVEGEIAKRKIAVENIMATEQKSAAVKPQTEINLLNFIRDTLLTRIAELDAEIESYSDYEEDEEDDDGY